MNLSKSGIAASLSFEIANDFFLLLVCLFQHFDPSVPDQTVRPDPFCKCPLTPHGNDFAE